MMTLETSNLLLRKFTMADLDDLASIFSNPNVMKYLGPEGLPVLREETETALNSMINHWDRNGFGRWAVVSKESGALIGCSGLRSYQGSAELVYLIDEAYWGKGLATEIAEACLKFGFNQHDFENIIAFARHANAASTRVMEKVGMRFVQEMTVFGIFVVQYEILREDYYSKTEHLTLRAENLVKTYR